MDRRGFMQATALSAASIPSITSVKAEGMVMPAAIPTPKTPKELKEAIDSIFTVMGSYNTASISKGDQVIRFGTYASSVKPSNTGFYNTENSYWPTSEQAIAALWSNIAAIREGKQELTPEAIEDGLTPAPATMVYWRMYPMVNEAATGICMAQLRAAFI